VPWQPHPPQAPAGWYGAPPLSYLPWWPPPAAPGPPPLGLAGMPSFTPWRPGDAYRTEDDPWPPYPPFLSGFQWNNTGQQIR
jgi:hypothetical protein